MTYSQKVVMDIIIFFSVITTLIGLYFAYLQVAHLLPFPKRQTQKYVVISVSEYVKRGKTIKELVLKIVAMDYDTFNGIREDQEGSLQLWIQKWSDHPDCSRILINKHDEVCGYWSVVALNDVDFQNMMQGNMLDGELSPDRILSPELPGIYSLYFITICIRLEDRNIHAFKELLESFFDFLEELAKNGSFIKEICANGFTPKGRSLCEGLGMKKVCDHKDEGVVYHMTLMPLLSHRLLQRFKALRVYYSNVLGVEHEK